VRLFDGDEDEDEDVEFNALGVRIEGINGSERGISKISTTLEYPLPFCPPPKNILFVDDVDARPIRG
jgi:hypothetical protein